MKLIKPFKAITKKDVEEAGGKGASLGEMLNAGIPVPNGFVVLAKAFEEFLEINELEPDIEAILEKTNHHNIETVERASEEIRALVLNEEMPAKLADDIIKSFKKLRTKFVAVRSSATAEDSASAAWAGQLDSFLNTTEAELLENVKKCWASLFTPRAIFYRFEKGMHKDKVSVAVVVQKMVASEVSGIAFSVHPVTQDHNQILIEAGFGLGEAIVSGQVTPDNYVIDKRKFLFIEKNINEQGKRLDRAALGGNQWTDLGTSASAGAQKIPDHKISELSRLIVRIEKHYGFPCDIEWALEKSKLYIVQSRPITTLN